MGNGEARDVVCWWIKILICTSLAQMSSSVDENLQLLPMILLWKVRVLFNHFEANGPSLNWIGTIDVHQSTRSARIFFFCSFLALSAFALLGSNMLKNMILLGATIPWYQKQWVWHLLNLLSHYYVLEKIPMIAMLWLR